MEINSLIHNSFLFSEYKQEAFPAKARAKQQQNSKKQHQTGIKPKALSSLDTQFLSLYKLVHIVI
jgi:hypothetical protein